MSLCSVYVLISVIHFLLPLGLDRHTTIVFSCSFLIQILG